MAIILRWVWAWGSDWWGGWTAAAWGNYSTEQWDFIASVVDSSFSIVLNLDSIGWAAITESSFVNGTLKVKDSNVSPAEWKTITLDKFTWTVGTKTLDVTDCTDAFEFNTGDIVSLTLTWPDKGYDSSLDVSKTIPQANSPKLSRSEEYTEFTPIDTSYDEGAVLDTRGDKAIILCFSKTASDLDNTLIKVNTLLSFDASIDYQQTSIGSPVGGETVVSSNAKQ